MIQTIRVTVVTENTAFGRDFRGEHGLAFWVETGSKKVLFDTGQTPEILLHNADCLGIDLASADAVILSHGHFDHTGGLAEVLRLSGGARLFLHPGALVQRFSRQKDGSVREIGFPLDRESLTGLAASLIWTSQSVSATGGLRVTGSIPRNTDFEDTGGDFYLDGACTSPDPIEDDQAVFFDTQQGTVVLLGCGHSGIVNTLHHVRQLTGGRPVHAVLGGTHLINASPARMDRTVEALKEMDVDLIAPAHCTGPRAQVRLGSEFPDRWEPCHVGSRFEFSAGSAGSTEGERHP